MITTRHGDDQTAVEEGRAVVAGLEDNLGDALVDLLAPGVSEGLRHVDQRDRLLVFGQNRDCRDHAKIYFDGNLQGRIAALGVSSPAIWPPVIGAEG